MSENLKTTTLNDGTPLTEFAGDNWSNGNTQTPFYQWADTSDLSNQFDEELPFDYYGIMYNHFAIETGKLAPEGWRIPTAQDFIELENYLSTNGHSGVEGNALKTTTGWFDTSGNGSDAIGFKGLPNGYINTFGDSVLAGGFCTWITSDVIEDIAGTRRVAINLFDRPTMQYVENSFAIGGGIRCIKE